MEAATSPRSQQMVAGTDASGSGLTVTTCSPCALGRATGELSRAEHSGARRDQVTRQAFLQLSCESLRVS